MNLVADPILTPTEDEKDIKPQEGYIGQTF